MTHPTIASYFKKYGAQAMLISDLKNVRYLSGFTGSSAMLLVTQKGNFFFSDFRYMTQAKRQVKGFKIIEVARESAQSIATELKRLRLKALAIEAGALTHSQFLHFKRGLSDVKLIPILQDPAYIRMVKSPSEIKKIQSAIHVNKLAFDKILRFIRPGKREDEIAFQLERFVREVGGEKLSFDTIVASGTRGALPHGIASSKKVRAGELITIDFGNIVDGYCSDETCTVGLGHLDNKQKEIYTIVKDAHDFALEKMRPGMTGQAIDKISRDHIE